MLLTSLLPEITGKKTVTLPNVSSNLENSNQDLSLKLQLLKKRLQKRHLLTVRRNSEKPAKKRAPLLRRFSFPLLQSKNDSDEEMVTPTKEVENYICALCRVQRPSSLEKIRKADKKCSCVAKDDVCAEDIKCIAASLSTKMTADKLTSQRISDTIQDIYSAVDARLQKAVWEGEITEDMAIERMNLFEKKLMRNLHCKLFSKILEEEEETDEILRNKINCLHWVTAQHLAAKVNECDNEATELLHKAMLDIATINFKESPSEKLECVMNCSRQIFALLKRHPDSTESADDYLPVLVYIVLQVNPSHLHSNIKYILLFSNSDRVVKGEEGYYFTHLCSVVSFIENINADSLNMSEEKFEIYSSSCLSNERERMLLKRSLAGCICEVYNQSAEAEALRNKQSCLLERSLALQAEMKLLKGDIVRQSTRSKISKAEISKFMASRLERSHCSKTNFVFHLPDRTKRTDDQQDVFINNCDPVRSEVNILKTNHYIDGAEEFSNQRESLNGHCDFVMPGTKTVELKIPQTTMKSEQIRISVPKNLLGDSVDVAFDVESYFVINDLKER